MEQYISKDALVAEIKRQILAIDNMPKITDTQISVLSGNKVILTKLLSFIDTLEVREIGIDVGSSEGNWSSKVVKFIDADGNIKELTLNKAQKGE